MNPPHAPGSWSPYGTGAEPPAGLEAQRPIEVLYVEDDVEDARFVRSVLAAPGPVRYSVTYIDRLADAERSLSTRPFDVVLLDLSLPDSQGLNAFRRLRELAPPLPIVILSGLDDANVALEAFREGAQDYVVKGQFDPNLLSLVLRYAISRKQIEREHRQAEEALRNFQKFEAIGRLAGGIAHDFNNLLTVINGRAELALESTALGGDRESIQEIYHAGRRAAALVHQLLAFSRQQVLAPQAVDVNGLIRNLLPLLRSLMGEDVELRIELRGMVMAKLDPAQFEQILVNLAANARDAMQQGGALVIETRDVEVSGDVARTYTSIKPGPHVLVSVSDTGTGMDEATRSRVFEPFFTTKKLGAGTGLGLATVYGIVKQSGGHIWVDSAPECGARFSMYFPATTELPATATEEQIRGGAEATGTETILVVEDEAAARRLFRVTLERSGYRVLDAPHGDAAVDLMSRFSDTIDLLVTDVVMPRMSGPQLAERLRLTRPDLAVLYVSGYSKDAVILEGKLGPDSDFLAKPFSPEDLGRKVRSALERRAERV